MLKYVLIRCVLYVFTDVSPPSSILKVLAQLLLPDPQTLPSGSLLTRDTPPFLVSINITIQVTGNNGGLTLRQAVPSTLNARSHPSAPL